MRFATRTFLFSFVPFALLLMGSFWVIQKLVESTVRDGLRTSLRHTHDSIARVRSKSELQNSRFLRVVGENASLKAGLQLLLAEQESRAARLTVEDQLRETCNTLGFDFLMVFNPDGAALAGVMRVGEQLVAMDVARIRPPQRGFVTVGDRAYQVASTPINQGEENLGILSIGEHFDFSEFSTPAVLARHGKILKSSIPGVPTDAVEAALSGCGPQAECEVRLRGESYISMPMESIYFGEGYVLRSLQSVDLASGPVQNILRTVFLIAGLGALLAGLIVSVLSARSIVRPIAGVVSHLRESESTGLLPEFETRDAPIQEIRELTESFNRAAAAIRQARESLRQAYLEFVGSLASALDARDRYTAGHSRRVSEYSCAIAQALHVTEEELDDIRMGALLHDIGKIGIADSVLQKPGGLTREEQTLLQQHPVIGRRILEGVNGFQNYLAAVELHHENWDGSGYPLGLLGPATPLSARIIHIADAYDAMTTDRPYRRGMSHEEAIRVLHQYAGAQFDAAIVPVFTKLVTLARTEPPRTEGASTPQVRSLAQALNGQAFGLGAADAEKSSS
ncbi:MAG TPA: HD domain-containing phosphohydrolase [Bryobacteraceae bacterium]|jgi:HD-GYP domain-containing protein (c-di-GMP phosphodiesterase class II)|nr:HD domain-containing phosphohydrolase [Bryobacteraceae bacterium]